MALQKIKELICQIRGVSYKPSDVTDKKNGIPIIRANNIQDNNMCYDDLVYITPKKIKNNQLLKIGDIVICTSSGSKNLVGKATSFNGYISPISFGAFCKGIRVLPNKNINPDFIRLFFNSNLYRNQISESSIGANINNIKAENIDNLVINVPNISTQNKCVITLTELIKALKNKKEQLKFLDNLIKSRFILQVAV